MTTERNASEPGRLTARSVLLSVLLGSEPPRLPVPLLVRTTELFGISSGTARTALSRMVASGELTADGGGWYALAGQRLVARQARQQASRAARTVGWRGRRWLVVVVGDGSRRDPAERAATRSALAGARLAELREGVWVRPDNLVVEGPGVPAAALPLHSFRGEPDGDPVALAAGLWDLDGWSADAARLRVEMSHLIGPLEAGDTRALRDGFVVSAAVLRHFQRDPLLPDPLLPEAWPGLDLRTEYDRYDRAYRGVLREWFASAADQP